MITPGAQPRADNQADQILMTASDAKVQFAEGKTLGIVVDEQRERETGVREFFGAGTTFQDGMLFGRINNSLVHQGRHTDADAAARPVVKTVAMVWQI